MCLLVTYGDFLLRTFARKRPPSDKTNLGMTHLTLELFKSGGNKLC